MEEQLNAGIHTKSGKSLMNAFLRARTAFGFEYLIKILSTCSKRPKLSQIEITGSK